VAAQTPQNSSSESLGTRLALGGVTIALLTGAMLTIRRSRRRDA
jgi:hypothetical protein